MKRFAALLSALAEAPRRGGERDELLVAYFRAAPAADAEWAARLLSGPRPRRAVSPADLGAWAAEAAGLPSWLVEESRRAVGDLAETAALLLEPIAGEREWPLHRLVEDRLLPLAAAPADARRALLLAAWRELPPGQHLVWNRLVVGTFRSAVSADQVAGARAAARGGAEIPRDPTPAREEPRLLHTSLAVLVYAQRGAGERSSHYVDYTFAAWHDGELVPVAKASGGLPPAEEEELDRWVRRNIAERFGPVRQVRPELVFELGFEGVRASGRHKAGLTLRAPRVLRWARERSAEEAASLASLSELIDRS